MHPIDRLGEIRQQIRTLRLEAKSIVQQLANGDCSSRGAHYTATTRRSVLVTPIPRTPSAAPNYLQSLAEITARSDAPIGH